MKNGLLFFFHMGQITTVARLALIPCVMLIPQAVPGSFGFWTYVTLTMIAFLLSVIHAPSDRTMLSILRVFRQDVYSEMKRLCQIRDDEYYVVLEGYQKTGSMRLQRCMENEVIYPYPITLVYAAKENKRFLVIAQKNLLSSDPPTYELIDLTSASQLANLHIEGAIFSDDKVAEVKLYTKGHADGIILYAKNNYHYREFLAGIENALNDGETL